MARLTFLPHVPLEARGKIEQIVTEEFTRLDPDNAVDLLHHLAIEIWETLFSVARRRSRPWSVATFERTGKNLVAELVDDASNHFAGPELVVTGWDATPIRRPTSEELHAKKLLAGKVAAAVHADKTWKQRYAYMGTSCASSNRRPNLPHPRPRRPRNAPHDPLTDSRNERLAQEADTPGGKSDAVSPAHVGRS